MTDAEARLWEFCLRAAQRQAQDHLSPTPR